ncbi:hypothetical protein [Methylocaldum sp. 14B]|jgi:hypothetical protein|uniref:hypothetical protein n=1 Tax=unclassified Methylocaldum TaxID=2622260 RepID=UPI000989DFC4|nr:hypothetical protein [Methylocaldum sp. 14B]
MTPRLRRQECDPAIQADAPVPPAFPSARYFQIHFEQLYQLIHELREKLDATARELAQLRALTGADVERSQTDSDTPVSPVGRGISTVIDTPTQAEAREKTKREISDCQSQRRLTNRRKPAVRQS